MWRLGGDGGVVSKCFDVRTSVIPICLPSFFYAIVLVAPLYLD